MKYVLFAFLAYLLYQFIFHFLVPVYRVSQKMKKGFHEMHRRMQEEQGNFQDQSGTAQANPSPNKGDYIEFEELN